MNYIISNFTGKEYIKIKNIYFFYQGYGLTETTSTAAITEEDDISVGLVGAPLQGTNYEHVRKKYLLHVSPKKNFFCNQVWISNWCLGMKEITLSRILLDLEEKFTLVIT